MELKMRINKAISSPQILGIFDVSDESKIRFVIENAGPANVVVVRARITGQSSFTTIKTITGAVSEVVNVFTYEEVQVECTAFDSTSNIVTVLASSFSEAGGAAIESIGVPSGDTLTDIESLTFTSSDNSISIVGDNVTKSIDFTTDVASLAYTPADATDWSPTPTTIVDGLDQLADRTKAVETDLPNKIDSSEKGAANGVAPLNASAKIDALYLPSYVDDVEEYANLAAFPLIGESGKIYVALDNSKCYRWSGSTYVEVSPSEVNSVNGQVGIVVLDKTDVGLDQVDNTSDLDKPISTATQDALDLKYDASNPANYVDAAGAAAAAPVQSVNGEVGIVVLDATEILMDSEVTTVEQKLINLQTDIDNLVAEDIGYTPATPGNWELPTPTEVKGALDSLEANKANVLHTHDITDLNQSGAATDNFIKWDGMSWVAANANALITDYTPAQPADWNTPPTIVSNALDELSSRVQVLDNSSTTTSEIFTDMKEPTGFVNRTDSAISFDNITRIFTIQPVGPSYSVYHLGVKTTITTTLTLPLPNISGNYYIYINSSGALTYTTTFDLQLISSYAYCSYIYWDAIDEKAVIFGDERHGITMDGTTHAYLHTTRGTQLVSGAAISYTLGSGSLDTHAQISLGDMQIKDEDITVQITNDPTPDAPFEQILSPIAEIPIVYREGTIWKKATATQFPMLLQAGDVRASYNEFTGLTWQLTEAPSNNKTLVTYIFATTSVEEPVIGILGQSQYNNIDEARGDASWENINFGDLPSPEMKLLYTLYYETSSGFGNAIKCAIQYVADHRFTHDREVSAAVFNSDHANLSGLGNDDHLQYHTDARGDVRYYTKTQIDSTVTGLQNDINTRALDSAVIKKNGTVAFTADQSMGGNKLTNVANPVALTDAVNLQTLNSALGASTEIFETSFSIASNQISPANITDFLFPNGVVRSFEALVSVTITATANLYETFEIRGIQKASDWFISISSEGDNSGVILTINSSGQMQYTSASYAGFVSGILKFRAITTSV